MKKKEKRKEKKRREEEKKRERKLENQNDRSVPQTVLSQRTWNHKDHLFFYSILKKIRPLFRFQLASPSSINYDKERAKTDSQWALPLRQNLFIFHSLRYRGAGHIREQPNGEREMDGINQLIGSRPLVGLLERFLAGHKRGFSTKLKPWLRAPMLRRFSFGPMDCPFVPRWKRWCRCWRKSTHLCGSAG